jgi:uncharacterized membrane protein YeaQ/YmgE (transglycosylase-associated protein family)
MSIITWIIFGLLAGLVAKFIMPGKDPGGVITTILIGIAGALVGGFIAKLLHITDVQGFEFDLKSFIIAVLGSIILLFAYRLLRRRT